VTDLRKLAVYRRWKTDPTAERHGIWVVIDGVRYKIARHGNPDFQAALQKARTRIAQNGEAISDVLAQEVYTAAMGEALIRDWDAETFKDTDGNPVPYSAELAVELVRALPDLADKIATISQDMARYREADLEVQEKNSPASSPGS
jgi:hypothetical protein